MRFRPILHVFVKEVLEILWEKRLRLLLVLLPSLLLLLAAAVLWATAQAPASAVQAAYLSRADPSLARLGPTLQLQGTLAQSLAYYLLLFPFVFASQIAAYSVVGEKVRRTLEPLLATPVETWQLLLGKVLAAGVPSVLVTWVFTAAYAGVVWLTTRQEAVLCAVFTPGFVIALALGVPCQCLIAVSAAVWASARTNDPRSATQIAGLVTIPVLVLCFCSLAFGLTELGVAIAFGLVLLSAALAAFGLWMMMAGFQREKILTKWK